MNDYEESHAGWVMGPSLPKTAVWESSMNEFQNGVILVGGNGQFEGDHLYQLISPNGTWTEMKQTLKVYQYRHVSFLIPDELVSCH
jgi:hypothetical protein